MRFWAIRLGSIAAAVGLCLLIDLVARSQGNDSVVSLVSRAGIFVTLAVSLNLINGITGQFSIGHAAFYMMGAYTTAVLARAFYTQASLPGPIWLVLMMLAGAFTAGFAGLLVGLPSLKLRGDYLAIVTMGFGEILVIIARNQKSLGEAYGLNVTPTFNYIWLIWLLAVVTIAVSRNLLKNAHGLAFLSVREDEIAGAAMGVNVTRTKVTAFVLGSAFAGAAGSLYAHFESFISPIVFKMDTSFIILTMVVLGGTGSITGSVIAAIALFYIPEWMRDVKDVKMGMVVAIAIAIIAAVSLIKITIDRYHGPAKQRFLRIGAFMGLGVVLSIVLAPTLGNVPAFAGNVEGSKLRYVVFAATLIILMLLRPQGIFAHHELSWAWLKKVFLRKKPAAAVAP
ncbi:MAG: branched-chain amino acid ABC transporter permease [Fimbriimonadaceae bacterium]